MARRGGFPGGMGGFGGMNLNNLMKEAKKMQADLEKTQTEIASKDFESTAGGGAITVKVSGKKVIKEIKLNKKLLEFTISNGIIVLSKVIRVDANHTLRIKETFIE